MKVVIAAVMYSPNLGDGIIAECLTATLRAAHSGVRVQWLDLAGRTEFAAPSRGLRTAVLDMLNRMPPWCSEPVAQTLVRRQIAFRLAPNCTRVLKDADLLIIGGGQLFGDANLNFPLKLAHVVSAAERMGVPIAIHGVGVAKSWSNRAYSLFSNVLTSANLRFVSVRDDASARNLAHHYDILGSQPPCALAVFPDPGIRADTLPVSFNPTAHIRKKLGIGVVHPAALATHATFGPPISKRVMRDAYAVLATKLLNAGHDVTLFTNGSGEDEDMMDYVAPYLASTTEISRRPRFAAPCDLVDFVQGLDGLVSHRLHACIVANALGKTAVGLTWDKKIDAYFAMTQQEQNLFTSLADAHGIARAMTVPLHDDALSAIASLKPLVQDGARAALGVLSDTPDAIAVA